MRVCSPLWSANYQTHPGLYRALVGILCAAVIFSATGTLSCCVYNDEYHLSKEKSNGLKAYFPYSLLSVVSGIQAVSPQVTISHPPVSRLPLLWGVVSVRRSRRLRIKTDQRDVSVFGFNVSCPSLPLLSARSVVTFPAAEHHFPLAGIKLCCLVIEAHRCEQLAWGCYAALPE